MKNRRPPPVFTGGGRSIVNCRQVLLLGLGVRGGPVALFAVNGDIETVFGAGQDGAVPVGDLVLQVPFLSPADSFADFVMHRFVHGSLLSGDDRLAIKYTTSSGKNRVPGHYISLKIRRCMC